MTQLRVNSSISATAKLAAAMLVAACFAGCSGMQRPERHAQLHSGLLDGAQVSDWTRARADRLVVGENTLEISTRDPAFDFDTGKSFYRLLELPAAPRPLTIRFASVFAKRDPGFFQPDFLVLDRDRKVVRTIQGPLKTAQPVQIPPFRYVLPGVIVIREGAQDSAFLLVRTTRELLGSAVYIEGPHFVPGSGTTFTIPAYSPIPAWPVGTMWIDIAARRNG